MGKINDKGLVPPDDPMFSGGVEFFSRVSSSPKEEPKPEPTYVTYRELEVNWGGDIFTLSLDQEFWEDIQKGKERRVEVYEENFDMDIHWHFNSEPGYSLILDYGDPNHLRWLGQIGDAKITFGDQIIRD